MTNEPIVVTAAIIEENGRYLLARRRPGGPRGLLWEFPGGKVDPGESDSQALERELLEELGVRAAVGEAVTRLVHRYPDVSIELCAYRVTIDGTPVPGDHEEIDWFGAEELEGLDLCAADRPVARALRRSS